MLQIYFTQLGADMRSMIVLFIGLMVIGILPVQAQNNDIKLIRQLTNTWEKETNTENLDGVISTLTNDAIIFMPESPPVRGKEAIRATYSDYYDTYELEYSTTIKEVEIIDKKAYVWAKVEGTRKSKRDGKIEHLAFNNIWILKKQATEWKFWRVMFNSTPIKE